MKIAIITAGGAGMFCGSCMQDNTVARALRLAGADAVLLPAYTPIRVDEDNVSSPRLFLGGINVYLDSALPGWRRLPRFAKQLFDGCKGCGRVEIVVNEGCECTYSLVLDRVIV